jgi:carbonic anhydrase/acetyltransferase-like protein (isoleucine patch superfamily)
MIEPSHWAVRVHPTAWTADNATLTGVVTLAGEASVWYGAVVRGDGEPIEIGERSNIQDGSVLHTDRGHPISIGAGVSVGHRAVLHGCTIDDDVLIGMGAIVMNGCRVGAGSTIGAGALLPENTVVPPGSLVLGMPARVRRELTDDEQAAIRANAATYCKLATTHAADRVS